MIKIINKEKDKVSFSTDMPETLANTIRRSAMEIPILAVDEVEIYKNDSALYDEMLSHRIGLVPLVTEKTFTEREKCTCKGKGCAKCSVDLKIQEKGPKTVLSEDLKGKAEVVQQKIPLVILNKDQEIELVARAKLGRGIDHSKYSPGLIFYRDVAKIEIDKNCDNCKKCVEACPQKVLKVEKGKAEVTDIYKCDSCEACVEACKQHGKDSIKILKSGELMFFIESWGQIKAEEIFTKAAEQLISNLKELSKTIK